ncbi:PAS domain S-box protein [Fodinibius sp.]|uniref:PAS domain S-box protein n=1 Tax=Fodinibius sp. TaxID=1872440 RepID=UPI002ACE93F2|nr:PAS domain S-box protein [Fodinibius sp.]MDZ7658287.1 PAS domain S-box protein [Fodinibius sp.]
MTNSNFSDINLDTTFLDSLLAHVAIIDADGTIVEYNKAWETFNDDSTLIKRADAGVNYFNVLQKAVEMGDDYALKFLLGLKKVLNQDKESFSLTYPLQSKSDSLWFKVTIRPCNNEHTQFIMIHEDVSSTIRTKHHLEETQNRYQIQFEQNLDGILITDANEQILDANPAACKILGWDCESLIGRNRDEILNVHDSNYQTALDQQKKTGSYRLEMELIHKDGRKIPAEVSSKSYRNKYGKLRSIITFKDISKRKEVEENLIKNKHFTESILDSIPGAFFVLNKDGDFVRWNNNMITKLGYSAEELSDKNVMEFIVEENKADVHHKIQECLNGKELVVETNVYNKEGEIRDYYVSAKRFIEDGEKFIVGAALDMTQEKNIERENKKHQLMLEQLFGNAPVGITIVDNNNNIQKVNKSFEDIFGYSKEEATGKDINSLLAPGNKHSEANAISHATQKGESLQTETKRIHKDGSEIPVLIGSVPVEMQDEIIAIYGIYVDVSTQRNYREKIKETLQEKEALLSELHHRVKNNLALITSLVELQLFDAEDDKLIDELQNIKNRIMTIASIHEVLYQNGSLTSIPFTNFLQELLNTHMVQNQRDTNNIHINIPTEELSLNINQSIPGGLLLNEILSLIFNFTDKEKQSSIDIRLREYGKQVHLIIEGDRIINCPDEAKKSNSLHNILIKTLAKQLGGTLIWPNPGSDYQKFEFFFTKENGTSPASEYLEVAE